MSSSCLCSAITGDPARLQQVVWNMLSNAIKLTTKGGRVRIVTDVGDSAIETRLIVRA